MVFINTTRWSIFFFFYLPNLLINSLSYKLFDCVNRKHNFLNSEAIILLLIQLYFNKQEKEERQKDGITINNFFFLRRNTKKKTHQNELFAITTTLGLNFEYNIHVSIN